MMNIDLRFLTYMSILVVSFISSIRHRHYLQTADKWISFLLLLTLVSEMIAKYTTVVYQNDMYVYHVYSPLELLLLSLYFNERIALLKKYNVGLFIGGAGIILAVLNAILWQPLHTINSVFLMYEGFAVIGLCLYSFYRLLMDEEEILKNVHFWFTTILLIYWSFVFFYWGLYAYFMNSFRAYLPTIIDIFQVVNIITYAGFAIIFIRYRKLVTISE
jgi:hypothetical protein